MKNTLLLISLILIIGCNKKEKNKTSMKFEDYEFKLEGFKWDPITYKLTSTIMDSYKELQEPQFAAWEFSYIGDIENAHKMWDNESTIREELSEELKDSFGLFERKDAFEYILEQAEKHQIVIINEGHHMPQHRVFTTQLLEGLKKRGYKHLGLETYITNPTADSIFQSNGYPLLTTGHYTHEPQFGNLVRVAHNKGFKIFGYESSGEANGKEREINQAKNIQSYIEKYPNEKILIHCGFDHGYEGELDNKWEKAMAGRLAEFTNIDPLTINQEIYSERSKKEYENPFYQLTDVKKSSIFINNKGQIFGEYKYGGKFDIAVFHPRSQTFKRPIWLKYGDRKEVNFSFQEADIDCPCLVLAYNKGEKIGSAVPYDIQEAKEKKVKLILNKSDYEIVIWNKENKALKTELKIKN